MIFEDFKNKLTAQIRATGEEYRPHTGYPFVATASKTFDVLTDPSFDLVVGQTVKNAAGQDHMIVATRWIGNACLVSLFPLEEL